MDPFCGEHCTFSDWKCCKETAEFSCDTVISGEEDLFSASFQTGCPREIVIDWKLLNIYLF